MAAPWVLSALPECLRQTYEATGTAAFVQSKLPSGFARQPAGTVLQYRDCTLRVRRDDIDVTRGADRFDVPPSSQLFKNDNRIALLYREPRHSVLRIYVPAPQL